MQVAHFPNLLVRAFAALSSTSLNGGRARRVRVPRFAYQKVHPARAQLRVHRQAGQATTGEVAGIAKSVMLAGQIGLYPGPLRRLVLHPRWPLRVQVWAVPPPVPRPGQLSIF
jgi:hypothetical protein